MELQAMADGTDGGGVAVTPVDGGVYEKFSAPIK